MLDNERLLGLLSKIGRRFVWMHVEKLNEFDGAAGFTKAQGQA
jgi:isocitrate dehydrogenase